MGEMDEVIVAVAYEEFRRMGRGGCEWVYG